MPRKGLGGVAIATRDARDGTVTFARRLSGVQAERRARAVAAARELATEGGYAAVNMNDVAGRAGIARATLYRYFASKDHLLADVTLAWGAEIALQLRRDPPRGKTAAARVGATFARVIDVACATPRLTEAAVAAALSPDPTAAGIHAGAITVVSGYLDQALGDEPVADREAASRVLGHVFLSVLIQLTQGRASRDEAIRELRSAARLLFRRKR